MLKHFIENGENINPLNYGTFQTESNSTNEILARLKREGSLADFERLEKKTAAGKHHFSVVSFLCMSFHI